MIVGVALKGSCLCGAIVYEVDQLVISGQTMMYLGCKMAKRYPHIQKVSNSIPGQ
jgi:hypothetical protein